VFDGGGRMDDADTKRLSTTSLGSAVGLDIIDFMISTLMLVLSGLFGVVNIWASQIGEHS
jgi:hypothetical protein